MSYSPVASSPRPVRYGRRVLDDVLKIANLTSNVHFDGIDLGSLKQDDRGIQNEVISNAEPSWIDRGKHDLYTPRAKSILVLLPAWRDIDVYNTVYDLFLTANNPSRVHVLVVLQTEGSVADRYWQMISQINLNAALANKGFDTSNISWIFSPSERIRGAGTARRLAWQYAQAFPCDYLMSLDSHSRFALGWDTYLVAVCEELASHGFKSPCLTGLPLGFEISEELDTWTKNQAAFIESAQSWSDSLKFVQDRESVVERAWKYLSNDTVPVNYSQAKLNSPIDLWKILSVQNAGHIPLPSSHEQLYHPIIGKGSVELMLLGFLTSGVPHYQGQFLAEYGKRVSSFDSDPTHPYKSVVHIASQGYKIAGGFVFLPTSLARLIEFSTFFKSDDELLPSMRLIRVGAEMFTPNWNVAYHWYGRAGLPRPGWTHEVYDTSVNAMLDELNFLNFRSEWYSRANSGTDDTQHLRDSGFDLNPKDIIGLQNGVRLYAPMTKDAYYNKVGFHKDMLIELQLMECSSKREVPDLSLLKEVMINDVGVYFVRPYYVFSENMATLLSTDDMIAQGARFLIELIDCYGNTVGQRSDVVISKNFAGQRNIQAISTMSVKVLTTVFCYPNKNIPIDLKISWISNNETSLVTFITSELYTSDFRRHVISLSDINA